MAGAQAVREKGVEKTSGAGNRMEKSIEWGKQIFLQPQKSKKKTFENKWKVFFIVFVIPSRDHPLELHAVKPDTQNEFIG